MPQQSPEEIIKEIVRSRNESAEMEWQAGVPLPPPVQEDPDVLYRNKLLGNIATLAESLMQNMGKLAKDDYHLFVTRLIELENGMRSLNEEVNEYCDAANNVAMKDDSTGFADFDDGEDELELLTGDIQYELTGKTGTEDTV